MTTPIIASIGGLNFAIDNSSPHSLGTMQGWYSGAPKRIEAEDNPNSDGASEVDKDYRGSRIITLTGLLTSVSTDAAIAGVWSAFAGLQSDGVPSTFSVTDASGTKMCTVSVAVNDVDPTLGEVAPYTLQLVARDPVKYGAVRSLVTGLPVAGGGLEYNLYSGGAGGSLYYGANGTLGRVTLTNSGTATVRPAVTVTGALTLGFFVQKLTTGEVVRYDRVVPAGSTTAINFRTGEVLVDGVSDGSTYLTRFDFFSVVPGESFDVQFNAIGGSSGIPTATWGISDGYW